jgi:hypothetical protein
MAKVEKDAPRVSGMSEDAACMARSSSTSCLLPTSAISHRAVFPLLCKLLHVWHVPFYQIIVLTALSIALVPTSLMVMFLLLVEFTLCGVFLVILLAPLVAFHHDTIVMVYLFLASSSSSIVDFPVGVPSDWKIKRPCGSAHGTYIYIHVLLIV